MSDFLVDHALANAWCSPRQDLQVILKPARISFPGGIRRQVDHSWSTIPLPTSQDLYHVYQIGQVNPRSLGLTPGRMTWRRISRVMATEMLIADVYTNKGLHLNRAECYVVYTEERNLLLAVKDQPKIADLRTESLYFRLYSNAYFDSVRSRGQAQAILCNSVTVTDTASALLFQSEFAQVKQRPGLTLMYHNGSVVDDVLPTQVAAGDTLEYVYDSTVKQVIELNIRDLRSFISIKDAKVKYLLHHAENQVDGPVIDYRDDIDVYLVRKYMRGTTPGYEGVYYHKNNDDAFRQVTHRDYSVVSAYIEAYMQSRPAWITSDQLTLRLHVRHSGWHRPLVNEHHRIKELYKLPEADLIDAMHGVASGVEVWQAKNLENSQYVQVMDAQFDQVTRVLVEEAYGYNAVSMLVGNAPLVVESVSGRRQVSLPYGLWNDSTMYEYDGNGVLLGYYIHTRGAEYVPFNNSCTLVEGVVGRGSYATSTVFGQTASPYTPKYNYRMYMTKRVAGRPDHTAWQDVTGDDTKYLIVGNNVQWLVNPALWFTAVRSDEKFLAYDLEMEPENGLLKFSIDGDSEYPSGAAHGVFHIPVGKLDVWLNGRALIENLDYYAKWPQVIVVNKKHLVSGNKQKLTIRGTNFCRDDLTREPPAENGFVKYGMLSRNRRYDIRDDKVIRIVINGQTYERSILEFAEEHSGVQVSSIPDGSPYIIENTIVPLRQLASENDYVYRQRSLLVDQAISDYLTLKLPEPVIDDPVMIPTAKYPVYTPFLSTIMHDLINGLLSTEGFRGQYSSLKLRNALRNYEYLLDYDPSFHDIDLRYVEVHPHNLQVEVEVDIYQWRMLSRAADIYLNDRVNLARFLRIKPNLI